MCDSEIWLKGWYEMVLCWRESSIWIGSPHFMNGAIVECPIPASKVQVQVCGKSIFTIKFLNQVEALKVQGWHKYVLHCCTGGKVYATGNA